ncbi:MAG: hypothetical protein N2645_00005, partial [Clostridia bacterium]|nr:hypothetical protein [Clostridia bacterium]
MRNFFVSILFIFIFDISYAQKLYREGELLLKFRTNVTDKDKERKLRVGKANLLWKSRITRVNHIKLPEGLTVEKALEIYKNDPDVEYAEPNYIVRKAEIIPNDPYIIKQWFH